MVGLVLVGASPTVGTVLCLALAASAFYIGGMFLNDACDAELDARERPERPIPSGEVERSTVSRVGWGLLATGWLLIVGFNAIAGHGWVAPTLAASLTVGAIWLYDTWHKGNPIAPVIMGLCRVGLYWTAALSTGASPSAGLWIGSLLLLGYVLGLTYAASFETRAKVGQLWPLLGLGAPAVYFVIGGGGVLGKLLLAAFGLWIYRALDLIRQGGPSIGKAIGSLIAGIALLDALMLLRFGHPGWALVAAGAFGTTLALHRKIAGT